MVEQVGSLKKTHLHYRSHPNTWWKMFGAYFSFRWVHPQQSLIWAPQNLGELASERSNPRPLIMNSDWCKGRRPKMALIWVGEWKINPEKWMFRRWFFHIFLVKISECGCFLSGEITDIRCEAFGRSPLVSKNIYPDTECMIYVPTSEDIGVFLLSGFVMLKFDNSKGSWRMFFCFRVNFIEFLRSCQVTDPWFWWLWAVAVSDVPTALGV